MSTFFTVLGVVAAIAVGLFLLKTFNKVKKANKIQANAYQTPSKRAQQDLAAYRKVQEPILRPAYAKGGKVTPSKAAPKPKSKPSQSEDYYAGSDYSYFDAPYNYNTSSYDDQSSNYGGGQSSGSGSTSSYGSESSYGSSGGSYDSGSSSSDSGSSSSSD